MRIAILGGTGDFGGGLALRWALDTPHEILIGSRDPERAQDCAETYTAELGQRGSDATIEGADNETVAERASIVVLAVPPFHIVDTVEAIDDCLSEGDILVSPGVGIKHDEEGASYHPPNVGSVTQLAANAASVPVVGAFHGVPADRFADLDAELGFDTVVVGDDPDAKATVLEITGAINGLGVVDAGGVANAAETEALAPLLINIARFGDRENVAVKFR